MDGITHNVRALRALNMRRHGSKLVEIAVELGVTKERARQMTKRGAEIERRMFSANPWDELSARCRNALVNDGCDPTLDAVQVRYTLDPYYEPSRLPIKKIPSIGIKCIVEIQQWLARHGREPLP